MVNCKISKGFSCILFITIAVFFSGCCPGQNSRPAELKDANLDKSQSEYAPGELLIKFNNGVKDEEIRGFLDKQGLRVVKKIEGLEVYQVKIPATNTVVELVEILSKDPRIQYVEPNYVRRQY